MCGADDMFQHFAVVSQQSAALNTLCCALACGRQACRCAATDQAALQTLPDPLDRWCERTVRCCMHMNRVRDLASSV